MFDYITGVSTYLLELISAFEEDFRTGYCGDKPGTAVSTRNFIVTSLLHHDEKVVM